MTNGSGDFVIAFSTRRGRAVQGGEGPNVLVDTLPVVTNDAMSPLFEAVIEATEEAIYNSLFRAETVRGFRGTVRALPIDSTVAILKRYAVLRD
jgi:D-aminopeptidase